MATLSLCMIVRDEEGFLKGCLESVKDIVDEIIIAVDTRSSDRTKEIATGFGAQVFDFEWTGDFSAARNFSLEKATCNWILVMDADERLDESGRKEILGLINNREHCLKDVVGFKMDQRSYFPRTGTGAFATVDKDEISTNFDGHESSMLVRLFKNNSKTRFRNKVHELVETSIREQNGEVLQTGIVLHHFSHLKKDMIVAKEEMYVDIIWKQLQEEPNNPRYNRQVAIAFLDKGRKDLALKYFLRALKADPKYPGIFADIARLYVEMNDVKKAMKFFNMAVATNKKDVSSMNNLAFIYMNLGKHDVATKLLEKALEVEPDNKYVLDNYEKLKKKMS